MRHEDYDSIVLNSDTGCLGYIADMDTYELIHLTKSGMKLYGMKAERDYEGKPCYEVLQGFDKPCAFCTNPRLKYGEIYQWEHFNEKLQRWIGIDDVMIELEGRRCRLERARDVTEQKNQLRRLRDQLSLEEILLECLRILSKEPDYEVAFANFLDRLGRFYRANRAYIFELDLNTRLLYNTYEWCAPGVTSQKDNLQAIPIEVVSRWVALFEKKGEFCISSLDQEVDENSEEYKILHDQDIQSLMAAPIYSEGQLIGFLGVDDPAESLNDLRLLRASVDFIGEELKKYSMLKELRYESHTDLLTGLYNRNRYTDVLKGYETTLPQSLGIVFVDVNGIKNINDTYGHEYGDKLLQSVSAILAEIAGKSVYRIGGDEFVILAENICEADFDAKIRELKKRFEQTDSCDVSIGGVWKSEILDINQMLKQADEQMYAEKQQYYQSALNGNRAVRVGIASAVKKEIESNHFSVFYQPQIDMQTGGIIGAEALVRKIASDGKIIAPDRFISYYETAGVIRHVDLFVLESVCKSIAQWNRKGKALKVAVNFSRVTLMETGIVDTISRVCETYHVPPGRIGIEVTESVSRLEPAQLQNLVRNLRAKGFGIVLDDFGTRYSNLVILRDIRFDTVKIDRLLVKGIESNENSRAIVRSVIQMCHDLRETHVLAEGIETEAQKNMLLAYGCEYGQGYYYSKPVPFEAFERFVAAP